jgi:dimeric dUTPase (all-alpha-NTP-PPase superfamily)
VKLPVVAIDVQKDMLDHMLELQEEYQQYMYGAKPKDLALNAKIDAFKTMFIALVCELVETMDEVGWKPWATSRYINTEKAKGEVVDQLHFVFNEALLLGMSADELYKKYIEKQERNRERQRDGYTGVDEKCTLCGRDLKDVKVATGYDPVTIGKKHYCGECGRGIGASS